MKRSVLLRRGLFLLLSIVLVISIYAIVRESMDSSAQQEAFDALESEMKEKRTEDTVDSWVEPVPERQEQEASGEMLPGYAVLYEKNPDVFGWISVEDTPLSYPVMHTPEDPEYYLRRAFDKSDATAGTPFLDGDCFAQCGNYLIYGHNMTDGTMFGTLLSYAQESFWREHPVITLETRYEVEEYEVLAAFYARVYRKDEADVFRYYQYTDLTDPGVFADYLSQVQEAALYDTGVEASFGDALLTLSTCSYHEKMEDL